MVHPTPTWLKKFEFKKGYHPKTEFKKGEPIGKNNPFYGKKHKKESKKLNREKHLGKKHTEEWKRLMKEKMKGRKITWKDKISKSHLGEKNPNWSGGISFEPYSVDWTETLKKAIRERDKYICQNCGDYGNIVHHVDFDKKNCNPINLITLCPKCHGKTRKN